MFQSTLPHGERQIDNIVRHAEVSVSIHAPTRGATYPTIFQCPTQRFQSTLPHGERRRIFSLPDSSHSVSIHAPTRGATDAKTFTTKSCQFQSTLPHGERHSWNFYQLRSFLVSIHAPTRGATGLWMESGQQTHVSIHAPTRGATGLCLYIPFPCLFQSTLPHGERQCSGRIWIRANSFNPRSHTGSDFINILPAKYYAGFQSTLPHGERPEPTPSSYETHGFNPRSHTGSDLLYLFLISLTSLVSIHAPTRGATGLLVAGTCDALFQSTLPHGERLRMPR